MNLNLNPFSMCILIHVSLQQNVFCCEGEHEWNGWQVGLTFPTTWHNIQVHHGHWQSGRTFGWLVRMACYCFESTFEVVSAYGCGVEPMCALVCVCGVTCTGVYVFVCVCVCVMGG